MVQKCKCTTKYHSTHDPEVLLVNTLMQKHALAVAMRDFSYKSFDQPYYRNADLQVLHADDGDNNGTQMIGKGTIPTLPEQTHVLKLLKKAQSDYPGHWQGWPQQLELRHMHLVTYQRAQLGKSFELLHSESYLRPRTRKSYFATVYFEGEGLFIAKIKWFVKVKLIADSYVSEQTISAAAAAAADNLKHCAMPLSVYTSARFSKMQTAYWGTVTRSVRHRAEAQLMLTML